MTRKNTDNFRRGDCYDIRTCRMLKKAYSSNKYIRSISDDAYIHVYCFKCKTLWTFNDIIFFFYNIYMIYRIILRHITEIRSPKPQRRPSLRTLNPLPKPNPNTVSLPQILPLP